MIKKEGSSYVVYECKGNNRLGKHSSRKKAQRQIAAIEIAKKKKKNKSAKGEAQSY